ncbi:hypothetical protein BVRB_6g152680 [Beta vulgaris subsp. vulgaris]|nr:hypothetical protein BVRB_6g152680 [Beta vulgaris subsp. vulgaris]
MFFVSQSRNKSLNFVSQSAISLLFFNICSSSSRKVAQFAVLLQHQRRRLTTNAVKH